MDFHAQSLTEAIQAQRLPRDQRRYKAMLVPLNSQEFVQFMGELQSFVTETMKKYDTDDLRSRRLHQINFNIYAVSEESEVCLPEKEVPLA